MTKKQRNLLAAGVLKFAEECSDCTARNALTNLLANIRHACDLKKLDYAVLDREAYRIYLEEL
ncbi:MAG: hypothetical protein ABL889_17005 [Terricaulis sp.]